MGIKSSNQVMQGNGPGGTHNEPPISPRRRRLASRTGSRRSSTPRLAAPSSNPASQSKRDRIAYERRKTKQLTAASRSAGRPVAGDRRPITWGTSTCATHRPKEDPVPSTKVFRVRRSSRASHRQSKAKLQRVRVVRCAFLLHSQSGPISSQEKVRVPVHFSVRDWSSKSFRQFRSGSKWFSLFWSRPHWNGFPIWKIRKVSTG